MESQSNRVPETCFVSKLAASTQFQTTQDWRGDCESHITHCLLCPLPCFSLSLIFSWFIFGCLLKAFVFIMRSTHLILVTWESLISVWFRFVWLLTSLFWVLSLVPSFALACCACFCPQVSLCVVCCRCWPLLVDHGCRAMVVVFASLRAFLTSVYVFQVLGIITWESLSV